MKVAIVGSQTFTDYELMKNTLAPFEITQVISGGAKGADTLAENYADEFGIDKDIIPADWDNLEAEPCFVKKRNDGSEYNTLAGFNRNTDIVEKAELIIAFWDGESPGTKDTITKALNSNKTILTIHF